MADDENTSLYQEVTRHYIRKLLDLLYKKSKLFFFRIRHTDSHHFFFFLFKFLVMGEVALLLLSVFFQNFLGKCGFSSVY